VARNTAPCIGWACATIARSDPDAIIAVLPADHHIADEQAFRETLSAALRAADEGWMATIGIVPTRAETGYGYIEVGDAVAPGVHAAAAFVEKPNRERAEGYLRGGKHLWNGGMFFFRASVMRKAIAKHLPALAAGLDRIDAAAASGDEARALAEVFPTLPSISIDHGVMEKAEKIAVIPGSFGWNDVGSWQVAWDMAHKDSAGNVLPVGAVAVDAKNNLVVDLTTATGNANGKADTKADTKTWALVGVNDLVVVETDDAVLVIPRERAQDVRAVVDALTARGRADRT
jgi:mannose-1-phosphate guanylyltransferase